MTSLCSLCTARWAHGAWQELRGVPFRDDAFSQEDWQRHLTWRRYIPEPGVISIVILSLAPVWLWSVAVSAGVGLYATLAEPHGAPNLTHHPQLITPFSLTSFALSLLMLFKTTSSYGRWWEARILWGSLYITCRSILRLSQSFVGRDHPDLVPALYRWTAALPPSLAAYLRAREHYYEHLEGLMHPDELAFLQQRGIPPIAALQVLSRLLDRACLPCIERQQMEALLSHCDTLVGGCERILRQPIPYAWNRHTHRFILIYITFLPLAFWQLFEWATLPIMGVLSFLLCGIENVGVQIEEPFRVLPLNQLCAGTLRAMRFMMADQHAVADMAASSARLGDPLPPFLSIPVAAAPPSKDGGAAAGAKPPLAAVAVPRNSKQFMGIGGGRNSSSSGGGSCSGAVGSQVGGAVVGQAVEMSAPSIVSTPPTAPS